MKKSELRLFKLASQFRKKYASIDANTLKDEIQQHIQDSVAHASGVKSLGIMPFMQMLATDQAALAINVTRDGSTISVSPPGVDPPELTGKYAPLSEQVKAYLEKYIELFPSQKNGETISYSNLTLSLKYEPGTQQQPTPGTGIAKQ
jgi:hypothetical protein